MLILVGLLLLSTSATLFTMLLLRACDITTEESKKP